MVAPRREVQPADALLARRHQVVERLVRERWDLLVIGGGIVGTGALLDAASRGLSAALIEQEDLGCGTSSRSSRLIHGGLRYLQQFRFQLVHEALEERARLLRLAPHLVRLEPFLFPLYGAPLLTRAFYGTGMLLYDALGSARDGGRHRHLTRAGALELAPRLRPSGLHGGLLYHDGVEDDARVVVAVARTAHDLGAISLTRARATRPIRERAGAPISGVVVHDLLADQEIEVRAKRVLDATGVWMAGPRPPFGSGALNVLPSRGSHLLVSRERVPLRAGVTLRVPGRVVFVVPWPTAWIIGTTDLPDHGPLDHPAASAAEVDEILGAVNEAMDVDLTRDDLLGTYAGLRPLVAPPDAGSTVRVSREHHVVVDGDGVTRVSGGKYTTYRLIAADAVDAALGRDARRRPSRTAELPLHGALPRDAMALLAAKLCRAHDLTEEQAHSLVERHGTDAPAVAEVGDAQDLLRPLLAGRQELEAEIAWAVRVEGALSLDDILSRRVRLSMELPDRGASIAERVAAIAATEAGWDAERQRREVSEYLALARREYGVPDAAP